MSVVLIVIASLLIVGAVLDAANTLVSTRLQVGRYWPTEIFYRAIWPLWGAFRHVKDDRRREIVLSAFAPASLIGMLMIWVVAEILGWSIVWWVLRESFAPPFSDFSDAVYFSGVTFFTIGFGEIVPATGVARPLTLLEAFGGLGTLALVIGYLPALYAAYSDRETQLLMLDDLTGDRIQPISLIESRVANGELDRLYAFFGEWERWTAHVLETHTSYPMLALFRSQHLGQSWVTALGVVVDAAAITAGSVIGAEEREPMFMYRRGNRALHHFADRLRLAPHPMPDFQRGWFRITYGRMAARGLPLRDFDDAFERTAGLRRTYAAELESLIDELLAPRGFWSHTILGVGQRSDIVNHERRVADEAAAQQPEPGSDGEGDDPDPGGEGPGARGRPATDGHTGEL